MISNEKLFECVEMVKRFEISLSSICENYKTKEILYFHASRHYKKSLKSADLFFRFLILPPLLFDTVI